MASTDAIPVPRKNVAWRMYFAIRKNDGTLITSWAGADTEISKDGGAFADCTNEATEIGTSGCGYIDLTSTEMNADNVIIKTTVTNTDALPLVTVVWPEEAGDYRLAATPPTAGEVADAVWDEATAGHTTSGTFGEQLKTDVDAILADTDELQTNQITVAGIADGVWEEAIADHSGTSGSTAEALAAAGSAGDPWSTSLPGAYSAGTAGYIIGTNLDATVSSRSSHSATDVWAAGTRTLTSAANITSTGGTITVSTGAVTVGTNNDKTGYSLTNLTVASSVTLAAGTHNPQSGDAYARIGANGASLSAIPWNASWDAEVQSEVADALAVYDPPTNAEMEARTIVAASYALEATLTAMKGGTFDTATDSLEAIRNRGDSAWTTATGFSTHSAADVWSVATRVLTAGTNIVLAKGTGVTGFNDLSAAQVNAEVDTALADYDGPTNAEMVAAFTEIKGATWATTDTLEAIRDRGDAAWVTATGFSTHSASDVWAVGTRTITGGTITTYTGNTPQTGDAYAIVNSGTHGNAALKTIVDSILADTGTDGVVLATATQQSIATALLDLANGVETSYTLRQALRLILSSAAAKLSGAATTSVVIRDIGDTKDRITATVDADGNRTAVTVDAS